MKLDDNVLKDTWAHHTMILAAAVMLISEHSTGFLHKSADNAIGLQLGLQFFSRNSFSFISNSLTNQHYFNPGLN